MKRELYENLVEKRKTHTDFPEGLQNPSEIEGGFDCNHIGAWSKWQGNLDADILVIGQDWGDVNYFIKNGGVDKDDNPTNQNLQKLFSEIGINIGLPSKPIPQPVFFTNAILGIKGNIEQNQMSKPVKNQWIKHSNDNFTKELIGIIQPKFIITLGAKPLYAMQLMYSEIPKEKLSDLIDKNPLKLNNGILFFPFYHCGGLGLANRKFEFQRIDWQKAKLYINP